MTRRICVVTGTRAEYGLLRGLIKGIQADPDLSLQLIVTAAHLSPEFGMTVAEIEADRIEIADRLEILLSSDSKVGVGKAMGLGTIGFTDSFARLAPDLLVLLGDRFELLAAASAALALGIPIAHIHGGEVTEGAIDDAIRHAVTKMAHLHFVAAEPYRKRVIQLGEQPDRVFLVGGLGVDALSDLPLLDRAALEADPGVTFGPTNLLVTYHPETTGAASEQSDTHMAALLDALDALGLAVHLFFTMPNADAGGRALAAQVERFVTNRPNAWSFGSLGQLRYLSLLRQMDGVIGNSSSGLTEAPSLGVGTVNIGDRQAGRLRATSVIDSAADGDAIRQALAKLLSPEFQALCRTVTNPYGTGGAVELILRTIRTVELKALLHKRFCDLPAAGF